MSMPARPRNGTWISKLGLALVVATILLDLVSIWKPPVEMTASTIIVHRWVEPVQLIGQWVAGILLVFGIVIYFASPKSFRIGYLIWPFLLLATIVFQVFRPLFTTIVFQVFRPLFAESGSLAEMPFAMCADRFGRRYALFVQLEGFIGPDGPVIHLGKETGRNRWAVTYTKLASGDPWFDAADVPRPKSSKTQLFYATPSDVLFGFLSPDTKSPVAVDLRTGKAYGSYQHNMDEALRIATTRH